MWFGDNVRTFRALIAAAVAFGPLQVWAAPAVTSVSGTLTDGQSITVTGTGFGTKGTAKPTIVADCEDAACNPTSDGTVASWTSSANMAATVSSPRSGTYCATTTSGWESTNGEVHINLSGVVAATKLYINLWRRSTTTFTSSPSTENMKWIRFWQIATGNYPNWYLGSQTDGSTISYVEDQTPDANTRQFPSWSYPGSTWRNEEYYLQLNSAAGATDGYLELLINGVSIGSIATWQTSSVTRADIMSQLFLEFDPSNWTANGNGFLDDIYIDNGFWAHVVIGNSPTLSTCTHLEAQRPTAWSNTSVTFTYKPGTFSASDTKYLFVVDDSRAANSGYNLSSVGKSSVCPCR